MTKEAKVGLLLGLAFIVAIAVVLRGVHPDGPAIPAGLGEARYDDVLVPISERVEEVVNAGADRARMGNRELPRKAVVVPLAAKDGLSKVVGPPMSPGGKVRHQQDLPRGGLGNGLDSMTDPVEPEALIALAPPKGFRTQNIWRQKKKVQQVYVVKEGDSLSKIALAVYGQEEGDRLVNIKRIHLANANEMASIDSIFPGQRLKIPRLAAAVDRVERADKPAAKFDLRRGGQVYVVKANDSLWKIAALELGDGARYGEISKMNAGVIGDEDMLQPGMRLRMP